MIGNYEIYEVETKQSSCSSLEIISNTEEEKVKIIINDSYDETAVTALLCRYQVIDLIQALNNSLLVARKD